MAGVSRREQRKQEIRESILNAAIVLFERDGIEATALDKIAIEAQTSRPTLYKYFPSKQALVRALGERLWLQLALDLHKTTENSQGVATEFLAGFFHLLRQEFTKFNRLERDLVHQSMMGDSHSVSMLQALTELFADVYRKQLSQQPLANEALDVAYLAELSMGLIANVVMNWVMNDDYPLFERIEQCELLLSDILKRYL